jgi:light-regulated signal transduction histidine kinase (bacteriophytochrome)
LGEPFQSIDCRDVVNEAIENLAAAIEENDARIDVGDLPVLRGDRVQLAQLFQNLIGNAIKYRGPKSPVIQIHAIDRADDWLFSVKDNGIGIRPEYQEQVFIIFQRLHTREQYPGTGLGLALCKRIVERHGGRIWIEGNDGDGSIFWFTLPRGDNPGQPRHSPVAAASW